MASICLIALLVIVAIHTKGKGDLLTSDSLYTGSLVFEGVNVDSVIARNFGVRPGAGVLVASEPTGHIVKAMGLKRGDIITALNDVKVDDVGILMDMMGGLAGGTLIKLNVLRHGKAITLNSNYSLYRYAPGEVDVRHILFVLAVFFIVFLLIFSGKGERTAMVSLGAVTMVVFGTYMGFFDQEKAFASINAGTLSLLVGMGFFAIFFEEARFFSFTAKKIAILSGGDRSKIMLFLCGMTYLFSMFVNNLSTILIIVPITLKVAEEFDIDVVPLLICEVIASNLGGASSMVGDFPNMLISSQGKLFFHDFIFFMFPICLIELLVLFFYMRHKGWIYDTAGTRGDGGKQQALITRMKEELSKDTQFDRKAVKKGLIVLSIVVVGFMLSGVIYISAPTIALAGGFFLLAFGGMDTKTMLRKTNFRDILFFASLFVMVGAVDASGALGAVSESVKFISGGNLLVQALLVLWISAFLTAFLNAGPTTALLIPIIFKFGVTYPHDYIWWALSLGVLAGSCSTLTGATAGAVTVTMLEDYQDTTKKNILKYPLSFRAYSEIGVPIMFLFLAISTVYILVLGII